MRLKNSLLIFVPLMLAVSCVKKSDSKTQQVAQGNPFAIQPYGDNSAALVRDRAVFAETMGFADSQRTTKPCLSCHSEWGDFDGVVALQTKGLNAFACLQQDASTKRGALIALACLTGLIKADERDLITGTTPIPSEREIRAKLLELTPKDLGFYAAGFNLPEFERIFSNAEMLDVHAELAPNVTMPIGSDGISRDAMVSFARYIMFSDNDIGKVIRHDGPNICNSEAETFIGANIKSHVQKMSLEGEGWEFVNQARGLKMFACDNQNKTDCFTQVLGSTEIFPKKAWMAAGVPGVVRTLFSTPSRPQYWIRSSADGRFVGLGETSENKSSIVDLSPKLRSAAQRSISVTAKYDPAFSPDNASFMFQGDRGTRFCRQNILEKADLTTLNFVNAGCSTSDLEIGLYQALGANLADGELMTINGGFKSDDGYTTFQDLAPVFPRKQTIELSRIRQNQSSVFEKIAKTTLASPFHASWILSPSNKLAIGTISGATNGKARHAGLRVLLIDDKLKASTTLPEMRDASSGLLCVPGGEKGNVSFDERYLAYYAYEKHADTVLANQSSADLLVLDLLGNGKPVKITSLPKGYYAQFPHFRSDGWLYLTVYESATGNRFVMATDAVVRMRTN